MRRSWPACILAAATVLLAIMDVVTTEILIRMGGEEGQPLIAWLMSHLGIWWIVPKLFANIAITAFLLVVWRYRMAKVAMVAYVAIYSFAMAYHCALLAGYTVIG